MLIATLGASNFSHAQHTGSHFDHLTIGDGLSHNTVYDIVQDRHGFVWIATHHGLNRYDGYNFKKYNSRETENGRVGFGGKTVLSLLEDRAGNLWAGTQRNGLNVKMTGFDDFVNLKEETAFEEIKEVPISSIYEDKAGNIWVTTIGEGILKYDPVTKESKHFTNENSGLHSDYAFAVIEDQYGTLWIGTAGYGLSYLVNDDYFAEVHANIHDNENMSGYHKMFVLDGDYLWIGTEGSGLYRMHIKTRDFTHFSEGNHDGGLNSNLVRGILKGADGRIYISTDGGGLNILTPDTNKTTWTTYRPGEKTALNSNALFCLIQDQAQNIWIGTYDGGMNIYKPHKTWFDAFTPLTDHNGELSHRSILAVHQTKDEQIWIGTDGGGLNKLSEKDGEFSFSAYKTNPEAANSIVENVVKTIFEDQQGRLWLGHYGHGLSLFDRQQNTFQPLSAVPENFNSSAWDIAERQNGDLWVATLSEGIGVYDPANLEFIQHYLHTDSVGSLAQNDVRVILVDSKDHVWVGTGDNGLNRWTAENQYFEHFQHKVDDSNSLSNNEIRTIFEDSQKRIWIGTEGGGLNLWLGDSTFQHITTEDGLLANSIMGLAEDEEGHLWITTFEGISRFNADEQLIQNFNFHTGQNNNQFNQEAIAETADGRIFMGGINGLNVIHPNEVSHQVFNSAIVFTNLEVLDQQIFAGKLADGRRILDRPIEDAKEIYLQYNDKSFSIAFSSLDFTNGLQNNYEYMMEGFDEQWHTTAPGEHIVSYTNLDPGSFTFRVRQGTNESNIQIHVQPPFWKTWWFQLLSLVLVLTSAISANRFAIKRKEEQHQQQLLEAKSEILELRNKNLKTEVSAKNSKLMSSAVQMAHKNEVLTRLKEELKGLNKDSGANLRQLIRALDRELEGADYWREFNIYFDQVDEGFVQSMKTKHPDLTQNDLRICTLMRINLNTKEIASLLNVSVRGVEKSRYRLKKRLGLSKEDDLAEYILQF